MIAGYQIIYKSAEIIMYGIIWMFKDTSKLGQ